MDKTLNRSGRVGQKVMTLYDITFWPTLYRLADCFHMSVSVGFGRGLHLCHAPVEFSPEDDARCKACLLSMLDE